MLIGHLRKGLQSHHGGASHLISKKKRRLAAALPPNAGQGGYTSAAIRSDKRRVHPQGMMRTHEGGAGKDGRAFSSSSSTCLPGLFNSSQANRGRAV